jgi:hypothetical protein
MAISALLVASFELSYVLGFGSVGSVESREEASLCPQRARGSSRRVLPLAALDLVNHRLLARYKGRTYVSDKWDAPLKR